jgi:hypothetical protein
MLHNKSHCSCEGDLVEIPCAGCQKPQLVGKILAEEFSDTLYCGKCFDNRANEPCETCGKSDCDGECCDCQFCIERRMVMSSDKTIVELAEAAVNDWEKNNDPNMAVLNIQSIQRAVHAKRRLLESKPLLAGIIRAIDFSEENEQISEKEGRDLLKFILGLFEDRKW